MKRTFFLVAIIMATFELTVFSQKININDGWSFVRGFTASSGEIKNQGSDWSSQYDVQHVSSSGDSQSTGTLDYKGLTDALKNAQWENVALPHTPRIEELTVVHQWQGICYYKKNLKIPVNFKGKRLWLEFEGAMHVADIWIDGKPAAHHTGGYLPFLIDITDRVRPGDTCEIFVRLDNMDNPLVPPGKPLNVLDFCYYGGIYRNVNLIAKNRVHITDPIMADKIAGGGVFVTYPEVSDSRAVVDVKCNVANTDTKNHKVSVRTALYPLDANDRKGRTVAKGATRKLSLDSSSEMDAELQMTVSNPRLWSPNAPNRYLLECQIISDGKVVDVEKTAIGIRHISFTRDRGFEINGRPLELIGTNRHQEYPYIGNALCENAQYRDIYQIKNAGYNIVRLGHYPQDRSVLDACDRLGLLAIEPIPGWQFFNKNQEFIDHTYRDIRQLIRRDRNHPSIVAWETTLNESWPPASWKDGAVAVSHEEYAGDQCYTSGDTYGYEGFDICYNDWEDGFRRPNKSSKPGFIREYYDYEFGGHYSTTRVGRGSGHEALMTNLWNLQWSHNRYKTDYPVTSGAAVWSMYDYNRGCCDNICESGVADMFRLPKYSLYYFRSQLDPGSPLPDGPMPEEVKIMYSYDGKAVPDTIMVFGNVDELELFADGKSLGRHKPDQGATTEYKARPDGGNSLNLRHAPFTFSGAAGAASLKAVGYRDSKAVAHDIYELPGKAASLKISYFESGRPASTDDQLIVYVTIVDKEGRELTELNGYNIGLTVKEGGSILGPSVAPTVAGTASFLVKTSRKPSLSLSAASLKPTEDAGDLKGGLTLLLR